MTVNSPAVQLSRHRTGGARQKRHTPPALIRSCSRSASPSLPCKKGTSLCRGRALVYFSLLPVWQNTRGPIFLGVHFCYKILPCTHRAWHSGYSSRENRHMQACCRKAANPPPQPWRPNGRQSPPTVPGDAAWRQERGGALPAWPETVNVPKQPLPPSTTSLLCWEPLGHLMGKRGRGGCVALERDERRTGGTKGAEKAPQQVWEVYSSPWLAQTADSSLLPPNLCLCPRSPTHLPIAVLGRHHG